MIVDMEEYVKALARRVSAMEDKLEKIPKVGEVAADNVFGMFSRIFGPKHCPHCHKDI